MTWTSPVVRAFDTFLASLSLPEAYETADAAITRPKADSACLCNLIKRKATDARASDR
jgi:hypothetical protein